MQMKVLSTTSSTISLTKPGMLALLTNVGASGSASWTEPNAGFSANEALIDVLSCNAVTADGNGGVTTTASGGLPQVSALYICSRAITH